jgi:hypothetical protein
MVGSACLADGLAVSCKDSCADTSPRQRYELDRMGLFAETRDTRTRCAQRCKQRKEQTVHHAASVATAPTGTTIVGHGVLASLAEPDPQRCGDERIPGVSSSS